MTKIIFNTRILVNSYVAVFKRPNMHGVPCITHPRSQQRMGAYLYKRFYCTIYNQVLSPLHMRNYSSNIIIKDNSNLFADNFNNPLFNSFTILMDFNDFMSSDFKNFKD